MKHRSDDYDTLSSLSYGGAYEKGLQGTTEEDKVIINTRGRKQHISRDTYEVDIKIKMNGKQTFKGHISGDIRGCKQFMEAIAEARLTEPIVTGRNLDK